MFRESGEIVLFIACCNWHATTRTANKETGIDMETMQHHDLIDSIQ